MDVDSPRARLPMRLSKRSDKHGRKPWHIEGADMMNWVLIDYVDAVVHVMSEDTRKFYGLEEIWGDAQRTDYPNE